MNEPIITLTTDFGEDSHYVAAMKGVILSINPAVRLVDLSHHIPPQDVRHAAYFLAECVAYFPAGTMHVAVVDPGVGTARKLLYFEIGEQQFLLPDNGLVSYIAAGRQVKRVHELSDPQYWRQPVSATFHGRDILAPVAGHGSKGVAAERFGPAIDQWQRLEIAEPGIDDDGVEGEVVFVDHFGNLITNIAESSPGIDPNWVVDCGLRVSPRWVRTYAEGRPGEVVALFSSGGQLEIAVVNGNAAIHLGVGVGMKVRVLRPPLAAVAPKRKNAPSLESAHRVRP